MNATTFLWIYIVFLIAGGAAGYFKAKSQVSLYTSLGFAAALSLCAVQLIPLVVADYLMGLLILVFGFRLMRTKKFMPAGMMLIVTILALACQHLLPAAG